MKPNSINQAARDYATYLKGKYPDASPEDIRKAMYDCQRVEINLRAKTLARKAKENLEKNKEFYKLTFEQKRVMDAVEEAERQGRVAYLETGLCKPFKAVTIYSLERKGLIQVKTNGNGVFHATKM